MLQTGTIFTLENEQTSLFRVWNLRHKRKYKITGSKRKLSFELNLSFTVIVLDKSLDYYVLLT